MKRIIIIIICSIFAIFHLQAQVPNYFKYQAVVRDKNGAVIENKLISLRISILQNSASGTTVYSEYFEPITNEFGLISVNIGNGNPVLGVFSAIPWGTATYYMQVEIDIQGGSNYMLMGSTQILAVPYALYALNVKNNDDADADPTNEIQDLQLVDNVLTITRNSNATKIPLSQYIGVDTDKQNLSKKIIGNNVQILIERGDPIDFNLPTDYTNGGTFGGPIQATNLSLLKKFTLLGGGDLTLIPTGNTILTLPTSGTLATVENTLSTSHPAKDITVADITNWKTAYNWGNHAGLYRSSSYVPTWSEILSNPFSFSSLINNQLLRYNSISGKWENWTPNFLTSYTESDPAVTTNFTLTGAPGDLLQFNGTKWAKFTPNYLTSFTESDPAVATNFNLIGAPGDLLQFNGTKWAKFTPNYLTSESDPVVATNFILAGANGDLLQFNGTKWAKFTPNYLTSFTESDPAVATNFTLTGAPGDLLQFNGTKWAKFTPNYLTSESDPAVATNFTLAGANGDLLQFNGTKWAKFTPNYLTSFTESDPAVTTNFTLTGAPGDLLQFNGTKWAKFTPNYLTSESDPAVATNFTLTGTFGDLLQFNGTKWVNFTPNFSVNTHTHPVATTSTSGFMSGIDKTKLDGLVKLTAGTGISINLSDQIVNALPDQTVVLTGQNGITITGTYPSFTISGTTTTHTVGETFGGGTVVYVTTDGLHGLIAETQNQSAASTFYNAQDLISNPSTHSTEGQKYADWRLPTKYELNLLYLRGIIPTVNYWCSTEIDTSNSWSQNGVTQSSSPKTSLFYVRAVRSF